MGKIEELFEQFIAEADKNFSNDKEHKKMIKALYYTSLGHFLMTQGRFILAPPDGKKMIEHLQMIEEIKEFMTELGKEIDMSFMSKTHKP